MSNQPTLNMPMQSIENGSPAAKVVLEKALNQIGFIPNMYGLMANSAALLDTYFSATTSFVANQVLPQSNKKWFF